jgi:hypothetical protein
MQPKTKWKLKMALSVIIDGVDLLFGLIPGVGHAGEFIGIFFAMILWGWRGSLYGLEMLDVMNVVDGFIPMASLIGLSKKADYEAQQLQWEAGIR